MGFSVWGSSTQTLKFPEFQISHVFACPNPRIPPKRILWNIENQLTYRLICYIFEHQQGDSMKKKALRLGIKLNNTPVYVSDEGIFSLSYDNESLTGTSIKELEENLRKARGVRRRKPLNLRVIIFVDEGWDDSEVHRGNLLGYHATNGRLRMKMGGKNEIINNSSRLHIVPAEHPKLPTIQKLWQKRELARELCREITDKLSNLLDKAGTDAHGSWSINIDNVLEKEIELGSWIKRKQ